MRTALFWILALAVGVVVGAGSLWVTLDRIGGFAGVRNGGWTHNPNAGAAAAGPYQRLAVAVGGLLALNRDETIYFSTAVDGDGEPLRANCVYRLEGGPAAARWWSITLYSGGYLTRNADGAHSIDRTRADPANRGGWRGVLGGPRPADDTPWISTAGAADLSLLLRYYNPEPAARARPERLTLPTIARQSCGEGA